MQDALESPSEMHVDDPLMSTTEDTRYWTTANVSEAMQGVMTPLDWTFFRYGCEVGVRGANRDLGIFSSREVYLPKTISDSILGAFYGRVALNVDFRADLIDRMPGASGADYEQALFGTVRTDVQRPGTDHKRVPLMLLKIPYTLFSNRRRIAHNNGALRSWRVGALSQLEARSVAPHETFREALNRYENAVRLHSRARFLLLTMLSRVAKLAERVEMADAAYGLTAAVGTEETRVVEDLWRLSRGEASLDEFLTEHGYHGDNENAVSSASWREDPRPVELTINGLRAQTAEESPVARHKRAISRRQSLQADLLARVGRWGRPLARLNLHLACRMVVEIESAKTGTLLAADVGRAAAKALGAHHVGTGVLADVSDIFYLTVDEVLNPSLPDCVGDIVEVRRTKRDTYLSFELPVSWIGTPEPMLVADDLSEPKAVLAGLGVSGGTVEGWARVISDPATDAMEPDDVLVCAVTDPSWIVSLSLASALVLDVGGPASHGAIVARELGIPCVVNTKHGTRWIKTGDHLRVDGDHGLVEILEEDA